jgi:hypothetical protein
LVVSPILMNEQKCRFIIVVLQFFRSITENRRKLPLSLFFTVCNS